MLKHLPKDALKKIEKTMLNGEQAVYFNKTTIYRRIHNSNTANDITYLNINKWITKLKNQLKNEFAYRVPIFYRQRQNKFSP